MSEEKDCTDDLMECVTECDTDDKECKDACVEEYHECVIPEEKPQPKVNKEEIKKLVKKYKKIKKYHKSNIFQIKKLDHE